MSSIPYQNLAWDQMEANRFEGTTSFAECKTLLFPGLRIREVTYSAGFLADHGYRKGHFVHCLEGELITEMENGESFVLKTRMRNIVSDEMSSHRSVTSEGARILAQLCAYERDKKGPESQTPTKKGNPVEEFPFL
jgi:predicted HNH restriction endonuclease